jgi:hypothetical protein
VVLVSPDNAEVLACGIREAADSGPLSAASRHYAGTRFTVRQSVDALLDVFAQPLPIPPAAVVRQLEELIAAPSAEGAARSWPRKHADRDLARESFPDLAAATTTGSPAGPRTWIGCRPSGPSLNDNPATTTASAE